MFACKLGHVDVVKVLVEAGADIGAVNNKVINVSTCLLRADCHVLRYSLPKQTSGQKTLQSQITLCRTVSLSCDT